MLIPSTRRFGLISVSLLLTLAACGNDPGPDIIGRDPHKTPATTGTDAPRDADDAPAPHDVPAKDDPKPVADGPIEIPFDEAFTIGEGITCRAQGMTELTARLPSSTYQFADCTVEVTAKARVSGGFRASVASGPGTDPWTVSLAPKIGGGAAVELTFKQERHVVDHSDAPLTLRFELDDARGGKGFATRLFAPAKSESILAFGPPRVALAQVAAVSLDGTTRYVRRQTRLDADASAFVFRRGEPIPFEAPFSLSEGATLEQVSGKFDVSPDLPFADDDCLFSSFQGLFHASAMNRDAWSMRGRGPTLLAASTNDPRRCHPKPTSDRIEGEVTFDGLLGAKPQSSRFAVRIVDHKLEDDVHVGVQTNGAELVSIDLDSLADFEQQISRVRIFGVTCSDDKLTTLPTGYLDVEAPGAAPLASGVVTVPRLEPKGALKVTPEMIAPVLAKRAREAGLSCPSKTWGARGVLVDEGGDPWSPSAYARYSTGDFVLHE